MEMKKLYLNVHIAIINRNYSLNLKPILFLNIGTFRVVLPVFQYTEALAKMPSVMLQENAL